jgi:peptide deformylase
MKLKIVQAGEPVLRQKARELGIAEIRSEAIQQLIAHMRETMYDAPGVGLAAPQIGESLQLAVIEDRPEAMQSLPPGVLKERDREPVAFQVIINPRLSIVDNTAKTFFEGCLSVAGFSMLVPRSLKVRVECLNERAEPQTIEAGGWYARILQHEIGHLHGELCIDHMLSRSFMTTDNYFRHWADKSVEDVCSALQVVDRL